MGFIGTIVIGLIVGLIARFLKPGDDSMGWIMTILIGIGGSLLATYGGQALGIYAAGQAAGFIEPLEASAIVMVELSLRALVENFPASRAAMDIHARRFNALFRYRWDRIVDFLKLHYALSRRAEPYWRAQRDPASFSAALADQLALWPDQPPSAWDLPQVDEVFSAASQAYVYYGMGQAAPARAAPDSEAVTRLAEIHLRGRALAASLPTNRAYLDAATAQAA